MLNLVVREIVERAQNDRLEHHNRIPRLASRPRFARLVRTPPHRLKTRAQVFPRNHPVDLQKRLVLGVKTGIPVPKIEKPHLTHQPRLPLSTNRQPDSKSTTPEKGEFLEVPLMYLAERHFLSEHHHPMLFDELYSLPHGPICSSTLNGIDGIIHDELWSNFLARNGNIVVAIKSFDRASLDEISDAEMGVISNTWDQFGELTASQLRNYSHENCPEYTETRKISHSNFI